jgi:hypothetical protein
LWECGGGGLVDERVRAVKKGGKRPLIGKREKRETKAHTKHTLPHSLFLFVAIINHTSVSSHKSVPLANKQIINYS